ncbi:MAG: MFS transporter [Chlamydiae bacterium CG10_big_fil_rev_8_21_14_0_10_42_34]|nr:MAG: MFS transporter [Chlamydiae bacterium CG10_big_fil_rev_8_21_14_0_10_42_34]
MGICFTQSSTEKFSLLKALEVMHLTRFMDDKMNKLVRQNKGATFHLPVSGHEMIGAVSALSLTPGTDWAYPYYRDRAFAIGLGCSLVDLLAAFLARDIENHSGGRMMPEHYCQKNLRIPCQSSVVGSQFLQAVGAAKSAQLRGKKEVVYVSGGDGSTSQGDFHEALNFSCIHNLPVIFVIQDNGWAISVPVEDQTAGGSIAKIAKGYEGVAVYEFDGCDYLQTTEALKSAVEKARNNLGPSVVVAKVPRIGPHSSSDDPKKYKTEELLDAEKMRDPIARFEQWLLEEGVITSEELETLRKTHFEMIESAAVKADQFPMPSKSGAEDKVYAPFTPPESIVSEPGESIVLMDAINHALIEEMEHDAGVVVFGQDVAVGKGGVFGITRTLSDRFGKDRCFNTPLAESTIVGVAIGMSSDGFHKPVVEIQFADYSWTAMNQIFNELSSIHYRSNGVWNCPIVIRMPYGGYIQGGPYHSQSIEAFLSHCPGLKIAIPSNAADAKRLLKAAIRDPNPVIFLEHKALYRQRLFCARAETGPEEFLPFGQAQVVRSGTDVTVVGWGMTALMANEAAEALSKEGISVEVIDLRTIVPLDFETVLGSIKKTGKLLIAHEAARNSGFGAELAARASEEGFLYLDAPVQRVTGKNCPVPYCKDLEDEVLPQRKDIEAALKILSEY